MSDHVRLGMLCRQFKIEASSGPDGETRGLVAENGTITFPCSSEEPYERYHWDRGRYIEILDHSPDSIRMGRLTSGAPLLKDHWRDEQVGVVDAAEVRAGRIYVTARFGNSQAAQDEKADVDDRVRQNVSVGYVVHEMVLEKKIEDGPDVYRVTDWEPLEVSTVSIPADPSVGFGRSQAKDAYADHETRVIRRDIRQGDERMDEIWVSRLEDGVLLAIPEDKFDENLYRKVQGSPIRDNATDAARSVPGQGSVIPAGAEPSAREIEQRAQREAQEAERTRVAEILAIGAKHACTDKAHEAIREGVPAAVFRDHVWSRQPDGTILDEPESHLGLSDKEARSFSILRAIRAHVEKDWSEAGFERECSQEIAKRVGTPPVGFYVPADALYVEDPNLRAGLAKRDLEVGVAADGGNLVATQLLAGNFIELLRNRTVLGRLGARMLAGLVGNIDLPRQATGAIASWIAEKANAPTSELTLDLVSMSPKTLAAQSLMTRQLMLQSTPAIEGLVRADLFQAIALGIDLAGINGAGSATVPEGILNTTGINSVALGTNGAAPTWAAMVALRSRVMASNADVGTLGFAVNSDVWGTLMSTPKVSGEARYLLEEPGDRLLGRRVEESNQIPNDLTKGTGTDLSAMIYGNWADFLIGEWGTLDLMPDPYTEGGQGALILRAFKSVDTAVRHPASFAAITDMVTNQ